tara:strand:+ start:22 stop:264 length:243 start_codon:yes stop_codon:yes gene_type:complete
MRSAKRLPSETFHLKLNDTHTVYMTLGYCPTSGSLSEVAFQSKKKSDQPSSLDSLLHELGIYLSRAIQNRDPLTGEEESK